MKLRTVIMTLTAIVICAAVGGCSTFVANPFAGRWFGTWQAPTLAQNGTLTILITSKGQATGIVVNTTQGTEGTFTGTVQNSGAFTGVVKYPSVPPIPIEGTCRLLSNGTLHGEFVQTVGGNQHPGTFDLTLI